MTLQDVLRFNIHATLDTNEEMVHTLHAAVAIGGSFTGQDWGGGDFFGPYTVSQLNSLSSSIATKWATFVTTCSSLIGNQVTYDRVDAYTLDASAKATNQGTFSWAGGSQPKGGGGNKLPNSLAVCCSLRTDYPGRSRRGRMFIGCLSSSSPGQTIPGTITTVLGPAMSTFLHDVGTITVPTDGGSLVPVIASRRYGYVNKITSVIVDNVWDWQSRRMNKVTPTKNTYAVT